jgi:biopolymer transport protein ExbB
MNAWFDALGPMAWPLAVLSALNLALILERLVFFVTLDRLTAGRRRNILELAGRGRWSELRDCLDTMTGMAAQGVKLLLSHRERTRESVEDIAAVWLTEQKRKLHAHLRWLALVAVASPLLGLLGTVLGMIGAFQDFAAHTGPVTPAVLANGLQQAMLTTAFGLVITIPALIACHAFRIWAGAYLESLENLLNRVHLAMEGIVIEDLVGARTSKKMIRAGLTEEAA